MTRRYITSEDMTTLVRIEDDIDMAAIRLRQARSVEAEIYVTRAKAAIKALINRECGVQEDNNANQD